MNAWLEHSVLSPAGRDAARIASLWWVFFGSLAAVLLFETIAVVVALVRGRAGQGPSVPVVARAQDEHKRLSRGVATATLLSVVLLVVLIAASAVVGHALGAAAPADALHVKVTGHQWWWEIQYTDPHDPSAQVTLADELHLPVGRAVVLELTSHDVIHSLWIPSLTGKRDLIPGKHTTLVVSAERHGVFRAQCAEFCGYEHAKMAMVVVAEPPEVFSTWLHQQHTPAAEPSTVTARHGRDVFLGAPCPMCHRLGGTMALATQGPDLSHLASRATLAAGALDNTRANLAAWIVDPQGIKPGCNMPAISLPAADLEALLDYLGSLR
jgi:cytochrome c oxidase subunit 2